MANHNLFLIHGAWCSKQGFNYLTKKVLDDTNVGRIHAFEYDCQKETMLDIVRRAKTQLHDVSQNGLKTVVVGHSMGGLIALKLSQKSSVSRTITLASPLSGLKVNRWLHVFLLWHAPILRDIVPDSTFIRNLHKTAYDNNPVDVLVAGAGFNPMIYEPSDGVVTIDTQMRWTPEKSNVIVINANHSEILQAPETIIRVERALRI